MSSIGYIQGLGGKGGYPPNWSELGYSDTPSGIIYAFDYAKYIANNWTTGTHISQFEGDKALYFFPSGLDLSDWRYGSMFYNSNLMYIPPITLGYTSGSHGNISLSSMFRGTGIREITILAVNDPASTGSHYYNDCFRDCRLLRTANINSNPKLGVADMFYGCIRLRTVTGLDTTGTQTFTEMFYNCVSLVEAPTLNTSSATTITSLFYGCTSLATAPNYDFGNATSANNIFRGCSSLVTLPAYDFGKVTNMTYAFNGCTALENVPIFNITNTLKNMNMAFSGCPNLTDTSLDNILQMCISATGYTAAKTLQALGLQSSDYPAARWQTLPHYQDFLNAGWTGYS